ncbi:MAG: hypothetical protein FWC32_04525 [Firmicutes bacterium]|nr:hypothetical protein [Bacillota bacterium]
MGTFHPDILSGEAFPYELKMPLVSGDFTYWKDDAKFINAAKEMVVEYKGTIGGYMFAHLDPNPWVGYTLWDKGDAAKVKRVYLQI